MPILHSSAVITPGQFGPIRRDFEPRQRALDLDHVLHRNALGDADDQGDFRVNGFADRVRRARRRNIDHRSIGARGVARLGHRVEHRQADVGRAALARRGAADNLGAEIGERLFGVEGAVLAGKALA